MQSLTITQPDDWHLHLRDGDFLTQTVPATASTFARAIVMPNLTPPVTNHVEAKDYRERILRNNSYSFTPLMTLYLTDNTNAETISQGKNSGIIFGCKLYPAGATTNSDCGVTNVKNIYPALEAMADVGLPLLIHGEVTHDTVDIFDREKIFIDTVLDPIVQKFPGLKIVLEHITTKDAADYVAEGSDNLGATITVHHLLYNRNDMLVGGIKPHYYCLPILKRNTHQEALISAATSGNKKFFLGTDSAPHVQSKKESSCGCAGIYSAPYALPLYAEVFEQANALDKLEAFASFYGADFYGLERNKKTITLIKQPLTIPTELPFGATHVIPIQAGQTLSWQVKK